MFDAYSPGRVLELDEAASVDEARIVMTAARQGIALVTHNGRAIGIVTIDDLDGTAGRRPAGPAHPNTIRTRELVVLDPVPAVPATIRTYRDRAWPSVRRRGPYNDADP